MPDSIRKDDANFGGKIFMPPSALEQLSRLEVSYPMLFELENETTELKTHCGVLEFTSEEGRSYLPQWMFDTLGLQVGGLVKITNTTLPLGSNIKIQPQSEDFLEISDPRAVLENALRNFSTLTLNDRIDIQYNGHIFNLAIVECKPADAICVVETDLVTDFEAPPGYEEKMEKLKQEHLAQKLKQASNIDISQAPGPGNTVGGIGQKINYESLLKSGSTTNAWSGDGFKLSGKPTKQDKIDDIEQVKALSLDGEPAVLNVDMNVLFFGFPYVPPQKSDSADSKDDLQDSFQGKGQSLRANRKRKK